MATLQQTIDSPAPASLALATSSQTPLPFSSLSPHSDVKKRPVKLPQLGDTMPMVDTNGNVFKLTDYTIQDIRKAIPTECFERSAMRGLFYIIKDIATLSTLLWIFQHFVTPRNVPSV